MNYFVIGAIVLAASGAAAHARPVIEKADRVEIDWSRMKIRFYGEAQTPSAPQESFQGAERQAWQEGLAYLSTNMNKLREGRVGALDGSLEEAGKQVLKKATGSVYSLNTTYFANGKIRVYLENALPRALDPGPVDFKSMEAENAGAKNSGIVLRVAGKARPSATYRVVTDGGEAVFEARDVAKESFEKGFMGTWFDNPSKAELQTAVGSDPVYVDAHVDDTAANTFRVNEGQWSAALSGNESLLRSARIVVAIKQK